LGFLGFRGNELGLGGCFLVYYFGMGNKGGFGTCEHRLIVRLLALLGGKARVH
jgi:hypothetical protein